MSRALGDTTVLSARRVAVGSGGGAVDASATFVFNGFALPGSPAALGFRPAARAWDGATWIELGGVGVSNASSIAAAGGASAGASLMVGPGICCLP